MALEDEDPAPVSAFRTTLAELVPRAPEDTLVPLTFVACAASFVSPHVIAKHALAGLLAGLVLMKLHDVLAARLAARRDAAPARRSLGRWAEIWPLVGAVVGLPLTPLSALVAGAVAACCLAGALLWRGAPIAAVEAPGTDEPAPAEAEHAAALMQAELPFGVFLGVGGLIALFAGRAVLAWYAVLTWGV